MFGPPTASMDAESKSESNSNSNTPPPTPPGLRPRASVEAIRQELGIPLLFVPLSTPCTTGTTLQHQQGGGGLHADLPVLPPRVVTSVLSPLISNASFHSKSSSSSSYHRNERIATSPNLAAPTTAVGALVATTATNATSHYHRHTNNNNTNKSVSFFTEEDPYDRNAHRPVLPPRHHWMDDSADEIQYQRLEDEDQSSTMDFAQPNELHHHPSCWTETSETSFSSHDGLVVDDEPSRRYNFDPILVQLNDVSAISGGNMTDQSSLQSIIDRDEDDEDADLLLTRKRWNQQSSRKQRLVLNCLERILANGLLLLPLDKVTENQGCDHAHHDTEGLGTSFSFSEPHKRQIQYHLRTILTEMDTARPEEFFLSPTHMEEYGETHSELKHAMEFVLQLLELEPDAAHSSWELKYEARTLLGLEVLPESKFLVWGPGVTNLWLLSLFLAVCCRNTHETPYCLSIPELWYAGPDTIRGGDTSLFSLPEESITPHTSNLSMATTITSKPPSPANHQAHKTSLRRTLDILGLLVHKLSSACQKLVVDPSNSNKKKKKVTAQTTIRATEEMKRIYLTIMAIPNCDLILVSDAFYPTGIMPPLIRTVSLDEDTPGEGGPLPQVCVLPRIHADDDDKENDEEPRLNLLNSFDDFAASKHDGPTRIMMDDYYEDDLRRTVGSNDYDDSNNDTRDLPPDDDSEEQRDGASHAFYHQTPQKQLKQPCKI